jgi:integrase
MPLEKRCDCAAGLHDEDRDAAWVKCDHEWQARFEVRGKRVRKSAGTTSRREAEAFERELRAYYERTLPAKPAGAVGDIATLAKLDIQRAEADGVTAKQLDGLEYAWEAIGRLFGGTSPATVITYARVEQYILARKAEGIRGQTIRKERQRLKWAAGVAHLKGWLPALPQVWPKIKDSAPKAEQAGKLHAVPALRAWFRRLRRMHWDAYREARLIVLTGLRSEETARVTWSWVTETPAGPVLHVPSWASKTRDERRVGLGREAFYLLQTLAAGKPADVPLIGKRHLRKARWSAQQAIGYTARRITKRDLRHTYLTLGLAATGDATATQAAAGHADLRTTQRYLHSTLERAQAVSAGVEMALNRHTKTATRGVHQKMFNEIGGRTRVRTEVVPRVSPESDLAAHLSTCNRCRTELIRCMNEGGFHTQTATRNRHTKSG